MKSSVPTKLTLRLDSALIVGAKRYAQDQDRSLSQLVADYFAQLTRKAPAAGRAAAPAVTAALGPITTGLRGALRQPDGGAVAMRALSGRDEYRAHLEERYR